MIKKVVLGATLTAMSVFGFEVEDKIKFENKIKVYLSRIK